MSTEIYEREYLTGFPCRDCGYIARDSSDFSDHVHSCAVNPIPMPAAEIERREADSKILNGDTTEIDNVTNEDSGDNDGIT